MVALMYGFKGGNGSMVIKHNVQLARELKTNFAFVYHVCNNIFVFWLVLTAFCPEMRT
jgi:hypothetical protein